MNTKLLKAKVLIHPRTIILGTFLLVLLLRLSLPLVHAEWLVLLSKSAFNTMLTIAGLTGLIYLITWMNSGSTEM